MYQTLKEKRYYVLGLHIQRIEQHKNFLLRNYFVVIPIIMAFSIVTPIFDDRFFEAFGNYHNSVVAIAIVCLVMAVMYHFIWNAIYNRQIRKIRAELEVLRREIEAEGGKIPQL
jgi:hypothetical protein